MEYLIFFGCNHKQLAYLQELKKQFKIILIDKRKKNPGISYADIFFQCGYNDFEKLNKICKKLRKLNIKQVFTASSHFAHQGCSFVAKKFNIKYPTLKNINICLDKSVFYSFFKKNNIKIPKTTLVKNFEDLKKKLFKKDENKIFYLKSDFGKNPKYLYFGNKKYLLKKKINWKKNQFFKKKYILQEKFLGKDIRINLFKDKYNIYDFENGHKINNKKFHILSKLSVIDKLKKVSKMLGMKNWLLKFDLIVTKKDYVVLDVGMDPPNRMREDWKKKNKNFINFYLNLYLKY